MPRLAAILLVFLAPLVPQRALAQQPPTITEALAACRRTAPHAPAVATPYQPSDVQLTGLSFARPQNTGVTDLELRQAMQILSAMARNDPHRADVLFRIGVVAMARAHEASNGAGHGAQDWTGAVRALTMLAADYPNDARRDETLYRLGMAHEALHDQSSARQAYLQVIRSYPQSRFVPFVYLSFGEYFFGQGDMASAQQFYEKVLELPSTAPSTLGYARYRLAWCFHGLGDRLRARDAFAKVLGLARDTPGDLALAALARRVQSDVCLP